MELFKRCPDCKLDRPITDYGRNASLPDGLQFYCKDCCSRRGAEAYRRKRAKLGKTVRERPAVPEGHKYCPGCATVRPHTEWHRNKRSRDGLASYCRICRRSQGRADYLRRTFGLTEAERTAMAGSQGGRCAICGGADPKHIDHDHVTGRVRGLLCGPCNMGLGLFKDDPNRLLSAIRYLADSGPDPLRVELYPARTDVVLEIDPTAWRHAA